MGFFENVDRNILTLVVAGTAGVLISLGFSIRAEKRQLNKGDVADFGLYTLFINMAVWLYAQNPGWAFGIGLACRFVWPAVELLLKQAAPYFASVLLKFLPIDTSKVLANADKKPDSLPEKGV